jgi:bifunctional DNA-binding transcriptional regulator/antitoxin component of YhaV-PrlF toxin-antitoxin module
MKATGIVRRIDDLGRVVIPKEIRRTMRIREGDPPDNSLTPEEKFALAVHSILKRVKILKTY